MSWALVFTVGHHLLSTLLNLFWPHVVAFMQKARFVSRSNFHLKQCRLASHNAESQIIAKLSLTLSIDGVALYSLVVCSFVRPSAWWHHHLSPPYDVLDHTNHIFSESLSWQWPRRRLTKRKIQRQRHTHRQRQIQSASKTQCVLYFSKAGGSRI